MSLAMYAASFEDSNEDLIHKKRQAHNKTQKQYPKDKFDAEKVNSMLHQMQKQDSGNESSMGDFNPPPQAQSAGVTKKNIDSINNDDLDTNNLEQNYGNAEEYYKRVLNTNVVPQTNTNTNVAPHANQSNNQNTYTERPDALMQKINYMINLLEEQQDERTNNVTEEVVLYSFLGIFVIFVVDSFVRVGKYVR